MDILWLTYKYTAIYRIAVNSSFEIVVPTRRGRDLQSAVQERDAHVRIEAYRQIGTNIFIDVFDSTIGDPDEAHLVSEAFPWTDQGAEGATRFLQEYGFRVAVMIK
jgi:hypothetical protein